LEDGGFAFLDSTTDCGGGGLHLPRVKPGSPARWLVGARGELGRASGRARGAKFRLAAAAGVFYLASWQLNAAV